LKIFCFGVSKILTTPPIKLASLIDENNLNN
jgi:hypothetical protein